MSAMFHKQRSKLSLPIIASIVLHIGVIVVLGYKAWQYTDTNSGSINGQSIDAIMVDPSVMTQQYQRQLQHQMNQQQAEQQRQQQIQQQAKELQEKQLEEQQRLKDLERERLKALEQQKQETDAALAAKQQAEEQARQAAEQAKQAKLELEEQQKQALLAKQKAEQEAKAAADKAAKEAADKAAKAAADKAAKEAADKAAKEAADKAAKEAADKAAKAAADKAAKEAADKAAKAAADKAAKEAADKAAKQAAKNARAVDDILGGLTSNNAPTTTAPSGATGQAGGPPTRKGVSDGELDKYKSLVLNAISNKFINPNKLYSGRTCVLRIQIAPDGLLLNVDSQGGDDALCREAISATKLAVIPKPSSTLYQEVKMMTLDFQPK